MFKNERSKMKGQRAKVNLSSIHPILLQNNRARTIPRIAFAQLQSVTIWVAFRYSYKEWLKHPTEHPDSTMSLRQL